MLISVTQWPPHFPSLTAQYFLSLNPRHTSAERKVKQLRDIFVGVDVWGRGQHGGGGLGCYKALDHIDPQSLGLSVALFGHAWTWESQQDLPGWDWQAWWSYERLFWVGPEDDGDIPLIKDIPDHHNQLCKHGPYQPISAFFETTPPPNPIDLPFFTTFSPGVGRSWFVNGIKVWESEQDSPGWTDLDKNSSLGDMVWPRPTLCWHDMNRQEPLPIASASLEMQDAWLGGNSLRVSLAIADTDAEDAFFRCVWIPIQSLSVAPGRSYDMSMVFKTDEALDQSVELDIGISLKVLENEEQCQVEFDPRSDTVELAAGWQQVTVRFTVTSQSQHDLHVAAGLVAGVIVADPSQSANTSALIGSLAVYPSTPALSAQLAPQILWMDFLQPAGPIASSPEPFTGVLKWGLGGHHGKNTSTIPIVSPEDPNPAWTTSHPSPTLLYCNVYVSIPSQTVDGAMLPENATFIGTTGLNGHADQFYVDPRCLPAFPEGTRSVRFYVQGLSTHGVLLPWKDCAFVDIEC